MPFAKVEAGAGGGVGRWQRTWKCQQNNSAAPFGENPVLPHTSGRLSLPGICSQKSRPSRRRRTSQGWERWGGKDVLRFMQRFLNPPRAQSLALDGDQSSSVRLIRTTKRRLCRFAVSGMSPRRRQHRESSIVVICCRYDYSHIRW